MTIPNSWALLCANVDSLIIIWLAEFNFEVVFSFLFTNQLHNLPPGYQVSITPWIAQCSCAWSMVWRYELSYYMISPEDFFWTPANKDSTAVMLCCISKKAIFFWCLSHVIYTRLMSFLDFLNWTKQQWSFASYKLPTHANYINFDINRY